MSTTTEIAAAIRQLPATDAWALAHELRDYLDDLWDAEIERDVNAGRLDHLVEKARAEHRAGQTRPLDEVLNDR